MKKRQRMSRIQRLVLLLGCVMGIPLLASGQDDMEIYIRTSPPGASIRLNDRQMGITPLVIRNLPPGEYLASGTMNGFRPFYRNIRIQDEPRTVLDITLEPLHGLLLVHSSPQGAELEINGIHRGQTPVLVTDLTFGIHRARFSRSGYLDREIEINVKDREPQRVHAELTSDTATLHLDVRPEGASVQVDGIHQGTAPGTFERVRTGDISLEVTAAGHRPFTETLALRAGEERTLNIELQPEPSTLRVTTTPPDARILINDRYRGRSPLSIPNLRAGTYRITAELEAHDTSTVSVRLGLAEDHVEEIRLTSNAGQLDITTEPAGVTVLLNDVEVGETSAQPDQTDHLSERFRLPLIPVGEHQLTLTKPGFYPTTATINLGRGETHTSHYRLNRRFIPNIEVRTASEVYRGILVERNPQSLNIELRPGIFKTVKNDEIVSVIPLRTPDVETE